MKNWGTNLPYPLEFPLNRRLNWARVRLASLRDLKKGEVSFKPWNEFNSIAMRECQVVLDERSHKNASIELKKRREFWSKFMFSRKTCFIGLISCFRNAALMEMLINYAESCDLLSARKLEETTRNLSDDFNNSLKVCFVIDLSNRFIENRNGFCEDHGNVQILSQWERNSLSSLLIAIRQRVQPQVNQKWEFYGEWVASKQL